jgi:hypothetical protein
MSPGLLRKADAGSNTLFRISTSDGIQRYVQCRMTVSPRAPHRIRHLLRDDGPKLGVRNWFREIGRLSDVIS